MRKILLSSIILFAVAIVAKAQSFTGQWKGSFSDKSSSYAGWGGDRCEYVLELECNGSNVTGYSYTYFNEGGVKYYTICKLKGKANSKTRAVEVVEVERTKTNVPYNIRNCFQTHRLSFFKQGDRETLEGDWVPAPNQEGGCGFGTTVLSRRILKPVTPQYNNAEVRGNKPIAQPAPKPTAKVQEKKKPVIPPVIKATPKEESKTKTVTQNTPGIKIEPHVNPLPLPPTTRKEIPKTIEINKGIEKRNANVLKTIEIESETFRVDLYDNGDIDGDTVSLIYNGALLMSKKRLSDRPISFDLNFNNSKSVNELTMYAENLGEIPPNTALMIVTDGNKRYEVRITSDLQKSGVIQFVHKKGE